MIVFLLCFLGVRLRKVQVVSRMLRLCVQVEQVWNILFVGLCRNMLVFGIFLLVLGVGWQLQLMLLVVSCVLLKDILKLWLKLLLYEEYQLKCQFMCWWNVWNFFRGVCDIVIRLMLWCVRCWLVLLMWLVRNEQLMQFLFQFGVNMKWQMISWLLLLNNLVSECLLCLFWKWQFLFILIQGSLCCLVVIWLCRWVSCFFCVSRW